MLLALDTSSRWMGIACYDGANVLYEHTWYSSHFHTAQLAVVIDDALQRLEKKIADIKAVGVAIGPGGFTGLRIGLALAKGLALSEGMALIGIPSLDALVNQTAGCWRDDGGDSALVVCVAVLQAGRGRFAAGFYRRGVVVSPSGRPLITERQNWTHEGNEILTAEALAERCCGLAADGAAGEVLICGEISQKDRITLEHRLESLAAGKVRLASPAYSLRRPSFLAELAWMRWQAGDCDDPATLIPLYLT